MIFKIITTINEETEAIKKLQNIASDSKIILVGDLKSRPIKSNEKLKFLNVDDQKKLGFKLFEHLPYNHYARKNLGYLYALENGAEIIYDTDDDNIPYDNWFIPEFNGEYSVTQNNQQYANIYAYFSEEKIWPRGFPLSHEKESYQAFELEKQNINIGIWQGLADLDPDVDAIYRLIIGKEVTFNKNAPVALKAGTYCPFNSQNTGWRKIMLPYAYLPSTVTFRFTDILRGYIAQRCLWEHDLHLGFHKATVYQERNEHDFMKDFESELPCYIQTEKVVSILENLSLTQNYESNLLKIYSALYKQKYVAEKELVILNAWLEDLKKYY